VAGNHELYNFDWNDLRTRLTDPSRGWQASGEDGRLYFTARPADGWTVIVLNSYEVSLMQDKQNPGYKEAVRLLREYNPNDVIGTQGGVDYFAGLSGRKLRYVPFNGGIGERQIQWLRKEVVGARDRGDRIIVLTHVPMLPAASSHRTVLYDSDEVLKLLHEDGAGRVVAVICGHNHRGGYAIDEEGVHHLTVHSPLTHGEAFGWFEVHQNHLDLVGCGHLPSRSMKFPAVHQVPPTATPASKL